MKVKKLDIIVDLDGIVVNLISRWLQKYNDTYADNISVDKITKFDFDSLVKPECGKKIYDFLDYDTFRYCNPIPGAVEALKKLNDTHFIHIVSAHSAAIPSSAVAKYEWCQEYIPFIEQKKITICHQKHLIIGDVIIDDKYQTVAQCDVDMGAATIACPWNQDGSVYYDLFAQDYRTPEKCWNEILEWIAWFSENFYELST